MTFLKTGIAMVHALTLSSKDRVLYWFELGRGIRSVSLEDPHSVRGDVLGKLSGHHFISSIAVRECEVYGARLRILHCGKRM